MAPGPQWAESPAKRRPTKLLILFQSEQFRRTLSGLWRGAQKKSPQESAAQILIAIPKETQYAVERH